MIIHILIRNINLPVLASALLIRCLLSWVVEKLLSIITVDHLLLICLEGLQAGALQNPVMVLLRSKAFDLVANLADVALSLIIRIKIIDHVHVSIFLNLLQKLAETAVKIILIHLVLLLLLI